MASESAPTNGTYAAAPTNPPAEQQQGGVAKEEVGWYFVEQYYNTLSRKPENLYLLYSKKSQFVGGVEEEKVPVCTGTKAIRDRIKEMDYQNAKVRVTNVDSQASGDNILVQVIGEMSNNSSPHRKFVQTFILAPQPQGYFLFNDIFRFIADEEDERLDAAEAPVEEEEEAPVESIEPPAADIATEPDVEQVDEKLDEVAKVEEKEPVNGISEQPEAPESEEQVVEPEAAAEEVTKEVEEAQSEKPVEPTPTPAEPEVKTTSKPKPATPLSWAQRLGSGPAGKAAAPAAQSSASSKPAQATVTATPSTAAPSTTAATSTPAQNAPARQPSPTDSNQDSTGGWQTAGGDHSRTKSRAQGPQTTDNGHVRAYVKNVYAGVKTEDLKAELSKYGELAYFDVSRQKNSAFVEFTTVAGFNAAVAANPHKIGTDNVFVEERRQTGFTTTRGGSVRGGRGGAAFEGRTSGGRGGSFGGKEGAPRGNFAGRGRGGNAGGAGTPRGGRPQAV